MSLAACTNGHDTTLATESVASSDGVSTVGFELSAAADSAGRSVRVCGARSKPADASSHCASVLPPEASSVAVAGDDSGTNCPCFGFRDDGQLVDPKTGAPVSVRGLCPSSAQPEADWKFTYTLYAGDSCSGAVLNGEGGNLSCYDSKDLLTQANPNASVEPLDVGDNANKIICVAETSSKQWEFLSCYVATTRDDEKHNQVRYDCGCAPQHHACSCGSLTQKDLEDGCHFDEHSCEIVCVNVCKK